MPPHVSAPEPAAVPPPAPRLSAPPAFDRIRFSRVGPDERALVDRALAGSVPDEALKAAEVLARCAQAGATVTGLYDARDAQRVQAPEMAFFQQLLAEAQAFERDCQVFGPAAHARTPSLYAAAQDAGVPGATLAYLRWLQAQGDAASAGPVAQSLRRQLLADARAGVTAALTDIAMRDGARLLGLDPVTQEGLTQAWQRLMRDEPGGPAAAALHGQLAALMRSPPLSAAQQAQAAAVADAVVAAHQQRRGGLR